MSPRQRAFPPAYPRCAARGVRCGLRRGEHGGGQGIFPEWADGELRLGRFSRDQAFSGGPWGTVTRRIGWRIRTSNSREAEASGAERAAGSKSVGCPVCPHSHLPVHTTSRRNPGAAGSPDTAQGVPGIRFQVHKASQGSPRGKPTTEFLRVQAVCFLRVTEVCPRSRWQCHRRGYIEG